MEERVIVKQKEMNKKVLESFLQDEWIHPTFIQPKRMTFKRISTPIAPVFDEDSSTLVEQIQLDYPKSSIVGLMNQWISTKTKKQSQGKLNLKQQKQTDVERVIRVNMSQFEKYLSVERIQKREEAQEKQDDKGINALTDFNIAQKEAVKKAEDTQVEQKESLSPEEIEKKRVDEFRKKRKEELDVLTNELDGIHGRSSFLTS